MKSRIAITAILAIGLLMSGTGATLAVVGVSSSGSSGIAQYGEPGSGLQGQGGGGDAPGSGLEGQGGGGDAPGSGLEGQGGGGNLDDGVGGDGVGDGSAGASSPGDQVGATDGEELPFSGFLAIPLLILGVGLVAGGAILRRRTA